MFSNDPYVLKLYDILLGDNQHWQMREAWVYSKNVYTRYPFQGALYGLPPAVIKECIVGAIEARYGSIDAAEARRAARRAGGGRLLRRRHGRRAPMQRQRNRAARREVRRTSRSSSTRCGAPASPSTSPSPTTEDLDRAADRDGNLLAGRPRAAAGPGQIIEGALEPVAKPMGPNARFGYPLQGRLPGADERLPAAHQGQDRTERRSGAGAAARAHGGAGRRPPLPLRPADQHHAAAGAGQG
jgi:UDP-galactopyranose mutase